MLLLPLEGFPQLDVSKPELWLSLPDRMALGETGAPLGFRGGDLELAVSAKVDVNERKGWLVKWYTR